MVELNGNRLEGTIPPDIILHTGIRRFDVSDNNIGGSIPEGFSGWKNLEILRFANNQLVGGLPALSMLEKVYTIDFSDNYLEGKIPTSFGDLTALMTLHLHKNQLAGPVPSEIGKLENLGKRVVRLFVDHC